MTAKHELGGDMVELGLRVILSPFPSYLTLSDTIAVAQSSSKLLALCQNNAEVFRSVDLSASSSPGEVLHTAVRSTLTGRGKTIRTVRCWFNQFLTDADLEYLPSQDGDTGLKVLDLNGCRNISDQGLEFVAHKCERLREFQIYCNLAVTDKGVCSVLQSNGPYLQLVNLSGCKQLGDDVVKKISMTCPHIEHLNLTRCSNITDLSLVLISEKLLRLQNLILYACHHMPAGNFGKISRLKGLVELDLTGANATELEINSIVSCCQLLQRLNLTWVTGVADTTVELLAENCPDLNWLSIYGNTKVTRKGFDKLAESQCHTKITAIDVTGCIGLADYTKNDRHLLKRAFPSCESFVLHS